MDPSELWWKAVETDALLPAGLPCVPFQPPPLSSSAPSTPTKKALKARNKGSVKGKGKAAKKEKRTLLALMNGNIIAMRRLRRTHAKFAALDESNKDESGGDEEMRKAAAEGMMEDMPEIKVDGRSWRKKVGLKKGVEVGEAQSEDCLKWMGQKVLEHVGFQGTVCPPKASSIIR